MNVAPSATLIQFPELDSLTSPLAVRVDKARSPPTESRLTPAPPSRSPARTHQFLPPGWPAKNLGRHHPGADNTLTVKANQAGLPRTVDQGQSGDAARYVGVYIGDENTHVVPGCQRRQRQTPWARSLTDGTGDAFPELQLPGRGGADHYLYIYDQGGPTTPTTT